MKQYILTFIFCLLATIFFAVLQKSPKRFIAYSALLGAVGYVVFLVLKNHVSQLFGYFVATLLISIGAEILARVLKTPASIFMTPAVIPLVPGMGLYKTMLALVGQDVALAAREGSATMLIISVMAGAIALNSFFVRMFVGVIKSYKARDKKA